MGVMRELGMRRKESRTRSHRGCKSLVCWKMTPLNDVRVIGRDQALEYRDLTANGVTAFRLPDVSRLRQLLNLLHRRNDVSALG